MNAHKSTQISSRLSKNYKPINSDVVLEVFKKRGWNLAEHIGSGLGRHLYTMKNDSYVNANGDALTITMQNSFDGSCRFALYGGYMRLVCSNGLVIGDFAGIRTKHIGDDIYEKIENSYDKIVAHLDDMKLRVEKLKNTNLTTEQTKEIVMNISKRIFEKNTDKVLAEVVGIRPYILNRMVTPMRNADVATDAFTRLNVVQERLIRKGHLFAEVKTTNKDTNMSEIGESTKRQTENKLSALALNLIVSEEFLKAVA